MLVIHSEWILTSEKKNEKIMWAFGLLDYKCKIIFKFKRNIGQKLIDGRDVKIEKIHYKSLNPLL
jgi:hypothetical protein